MMKNKKSSDEYLMKKRKHHGAAVASSSGVRRGGIRRRVKDSDSDPGSGVSTTLKLYEEPWKIKKRLTESDLGILSRLLVAADVVKREMLPMLREEEARAADTDEGTEVRVWDMDTKTMHHLVLKRWSSSKSYVLIGKWNQDFVRRRDLKRGDEIGLYWDPFSTVFNFSLLSRA